MNRCMLGGTISTYGVRLSYTQASKPQLHFSLTLTDGDYHTFVPCQIVGAQAEVLAETLEPGDYCLFEGKLSWKKEQSKLLVVGFGVEKLQTGERSDASESGSGLDEVACNLEAPEPVPGHKTRKRATPAHLKREWRPAGLISEN